MSDKYVFQKRPVLDDYKFVPKYSANRIFRVTPEDLELLF